MMAGHGWLRSWSWRRPSTTVHSPRWQGVSLRGCGQESSWISGRRGWRQPRPTASTLPHSASSWPKPWKTGGRRRRGKQEEGGGGEEGQERPNEKLGTSTTSVSRPRTAPNGTTWRPGSSASTTTSESSGATRNMKRRKRRFPRSSSRFSHAIALGNLFGVCGLVESGYTFIRQ